jgi:hypothetical protein
VTGALEIPAPPSNRYPLSPYRSLPCQRSSPDRQFRCSRAEGVHRDRHLLPLPVGLDPATICRGQYGEPKRGRIRRQYFPLDLSHLRAQLRAQVDAPLVGELSRNPGPGLGRGRRERAVGIATHYQRDQQEVCTPASRKRSREWAVGGRAATHGQDVGPTPCPCPCHPELILGLRSHTRLPAASRSNSSAPFTRGGHSHYDLRIHICVLGFALSGCP